MAIVNLSFDYEMSWGLLSVSGLSLLNTDIERDVLQGTEHVPKVLDSLSRHDVFTTWGIVAASSYKNWDDLQAATPSLYNALQESKILDLDGLRKQYPGGELFFSPELVNEIVGRKNTEVVSHGGYHLYLGDNRLPDVIALEDLRFSLKRLEQLANRKVDKYIAPKNQVKKEQVIIDSGITITRPNPLLFNRIRYSSELPFAGFLRLYSDLVNPSFCNFFGGKACLVFLRIDRSEGIFKKQYNFIKEKINHYGEDVFFFFYIHPHNFASKSALAKFQKLIDLFAELRDMGKIKLCDFKGH